MTVSTRSRFEILKRDGFRCRYCGATAMSGVLHVDHVVATAKGGTDDPANLVAACSACNLGKSDKPLDAVDEKRAGSTASQEAMTAHAEVMRGYLAAVQEVEAVREEAIEWLRVEWEQRIGYQTPANYPQIMRAAILSHPLDRILRALDATGGAADRLTKTVQVITYFRACLKNMRDEATPPADDTDPTGLVAATAVRVLAPGHHEEALLEIRDEIAALALVHYPGSRGAIQCAGALATVDRALAWARKGKS